MYFFDKKTMYLVWNMREGQVKGIGSVKFLAMDSICRIEVVITGCGKIQGTYPVYILSGNMKSLLGEILLSKGKGNLYLKCSTQALGDKAFGYKQITGLHIDLQTEGYLEQKWLPIQEKIFQSEKRLPKLETPILQEKHQKILEKPLVEQKKDFLTSEKILLNEEKSSCVSEKVLEDERGKMSTQELDSDSLREIKKPIDEVRPPQKDTMALYPNKWKQLCVIYPIVHPFGDGRAYLSIEPRDFVVLQENYQSMTQNSFLLHGFYHYRHLLLGRHQQGKNVQYYLGVPGVFYEKEKAAALFYGFESFEGAVTPALEGSFGYYMKKVQI